jgi:hypothetical protein
VVLALALAIAAPRAQEWLGKQSFLLFAPVPILAGAALAYGLFIVVPIAVSANATLKAGNNGARFLQRALGATSTWQLQDPVPYIQQEVLAPLETADRESPGNVRTLRKLSRWWLELWTLVSGDPRPLALSLQSMERAKQACPEGPQVYFEAYELRMQLNNVTLLMASNNKVAAHKFEGEALKLAEEARKQSKKKAAPKKGDKADAKAARSPEELRRRAREFYREARQFERLAEQHLDAAIPELRKAIELGPTEARMHYRLAVLYDRVASLHEQRAGLRSARGDAKGAHEAAREAAEARKLVRKAAEEALRLDRRSTHSLRKLTPPQRRQALKWATAEEGEEDKTMLANGARGR